MLLSVQYPRVWTEMRSLFSGLKCWSEVLVLTVGLNCLVLVVFIHLTSTKPLRTHEFLMDRQRFSVNRLVARLAVGMIRTVNSQPNTVGPASEQYCTN